MIENLEQGQKVMTIEAEILQTVSQMPESLKHELLHYAKYLCENYRKLETEQVDEKKQKKAWWIWHPERQDLDSRRFR